MLMFCAFGELCGMEKAEPMSWGMGMGMGMGMCTRGWRKVCRYAVSKLECMEVDVRGSGKEGWQGRGGCHGGTLGIASLSTISTVCGQLSGERTSEVHCAGAAG